MYMYPMHDFTSNIHNSSNQLDSHIIFILYHNNSSIIVPHIHSSIKITKLISLQEHHITKTNGFPFNPPI
ncbi:hypothetical protein Hanom_Chr13g01238221 [Helianthus anomalus]